MVPSVNSVHQLVDLTCNLCGKDNLKTSKQYERHVARHHEELALFALPRIEFLDQEEDDDERASVNRSEERESGSGERAALDGMESDSESETQDNADTVVSEDNEAKDHPNRTSTTPPQVTEERSGILDSIMQRLYLELMPKALDLMAHPPPEKRERDSKHKKLWETVLAQAFKLDGVDLEGDDGLRARQR